LSLFEYVAIAFSLIFSFAVLRLVGGISYALEPGRVYWVHAAHVGFQLLGSVISFWVMWSFREVEWTLPKFLLVLTGPTLYYFNASVLVPEAPASVESWREHYFSVRKRYWGAVCLWSLFATINGSVLLGMPLVHFMRTPPMVIFSLGIVGIVSASPRVHATLAIVLSCLAPLTALIFLSRPGALAQ
jgi:hypothetical protein